MKRYLEWYLESLSGSGEQGMAHYVSEPLTPERLVIRARNAPTLGECVVDVLKNGVSIFDDVPSLSQGETLDEYGTDFNSTYELEESDVVTLQVSSTGGASILSVTLVCEAVDE